MNTNNITLLVNDLAGHWTEPTLEILRATGMRRISVDMEVATWQTLRKVLRAELHWQRMFRFSTQVSLTTLMEQALREAALLIARKFAPDSVSHDFENQVSQLAAVRRSTSLERGLYVAIIRRPALRDAFKEPSRTDFVPRLQVLAAAH